MRIRLAHPQDCEALTLIAHEAKRHWGYSQELIDRWEADLTITAERIVEWYTAVCDVDERVVGFVAVSFDREDAALEHLWVLPERMGGGIGRMLMEHAVDVARHRGAKRLQIDSESNAEGFYLRMGARRTGAVPAPLDDDPYRVRPQLEVFLSAS